MSVVVLGLTGLSLEREKACDLLDEEELKKFDAFSILKRKKSFLYGRLAAKKAVKTYFPKFLEKNIRIENSKESHCKVRPIALLRGGALPVGSLSISHSGELAASAFHPYKLIGIDLEKIEERDPSFFEMNFTFQERELLRYLDTKDQWVGMTLLWTAKEAMGKAIGKGLSLSTLSMESYLVSEEIISWIRNKNEFLHYFGRICVEGVPHLFSLRSEFFNLENQYVFTVALKS